MHHNQHPPGQPDLGTILGSIDDELAERLRDAVRGFLGRANRDAVANRRGRPGSHLAGSACVGEGLGGGHSHLERLTRLQLVEPSSEASGVTLSTTTAGLIGWWSARRAMNHEVTLGLPCCRRR